MTECRARLDHHTSGRHHSPPHVERNLSKSNDNLNIRQVRKLGFEMRLARLNLLGRRLVIGRGASHGGRDVRILQYEIVIDRL